MAGSVSPRTKVFISYSREDVVWLNSLRVHLKPLERKGILDLWDDTKIKTGQQWRAEIQRALDTAKVAVLLISPDFLASDFIEEHELPQLLSAEAKDGLVILPVLLKPSIVERTTLSQFQAVNPPDKTLSEMRRRADRDRIWLQLAEDIIYYTESDCVADDDETAAAEPEAPEPAPAAWLERMQGALEKDAKELDLTGMGAAVLPTEIAQLAQLTTLYLSRNQLSVLPTTIVELAKLTTLYLARNTFTVFPVEIVALARLKELYFSHNKLEALPSSIKQLTALQLLDVSRNQLTSIPSEIGQLAKLQTLKVSRNLLVTVPSEIGQLLNLRHLDLSHNRLSRLPAELQNLSHLRRLDLRNNQLPVDPEVLEDIQNPPRIFEALRGSWN